MKEFANAAACMKLKEFQSSAQKPKSPSTTSEMQGLPWTASLTTSTDILQSGHELHCRRCCWACLTEKGQQQEQPAAMQNFLHDLATCYLISLYGPVPAAAAPSSCTALIRNSWRSCSSELVFSSRVVWWISWDIQQLFWVQVSEERASHHDDDVSARFDNAQSISFWPCSTAASGHELPQVLYHFLYSSVEFSAAGVLCSARTRDQPTGSASFVRCDVLHQLRVGLENVVHGSMYRRTARNRVRGGLGDGSVLRNADGVRHHLFRRQHRPLQLQRDNPAIYRNAQAPGLSLLLQLLREPNLQHP